MFSNYAGSSWAETRAIAEKIRRLPENEIESLEERQGILRDALNSFEARLADLPEPERRAALSMLYREVADKVFDFHLSIIASVARAKIAHATTREAKLSTLREFRVIAEDLAMLHNFGR
jgi:hypothetical protein